MIFAKRGTPKPQNRCASRARNVDIPKDFQCFRKKGYQATPKISALRAPKTLILLVISIDLSTNVVPNTPKSARFARRTDGFPRGVH